MLEGVEGSNCQHDPTNGLLSLHALQQIVETPLDSYVFGADIAAEALTVNVSFEEDEVLCYMAGYFLRGLVTAHRGKPCDICDQHVTKVTHETHPRFACELFTHLKLYDTKSATLFKGSVEIVATVRILFQLVQYAVCHLLHQERICDTIVNTLMTHYNDLPMLCRPPMMRTFALRVTRSILRFRVKLLDREVTGKEEAKKRKRKAERPCKCMILFGKLWK